MYSLKEEVGKRKTIVPFIYKGYRLYPVSIEYKEMYRVFLRQFYEENNNVDYLSYNMDTHMDYITRKYNCKENRGFFVFKDNELVGDLFISRLGTLSPVFINTIGLLKKHQGKGIGRGLMSMVETLAMNSSSKVIELMVEPDNSAVIDFYLKQGYTVRRKSTNGWNMVKYLTIGGKGQGCVSSEKKYIRK